MKTNTIKVLVLFVSLSLILALTSASFAAPTPEEYGSQRDYVIALIKDAGMKDNLIGTSNADRDALARSLGFFDKWDYQPAATVSDDNKAAIDAAMADAYNGLRAALAKKPLEPYFVNGLAQPIFYYGNNKYNDTSGEGAIRFVVYVESDLDTDGDGKLDLVKALVQLPRAALEGAKFSTIYEARPYIEGTGSQTVPSAVQTAGNTYLTNNPTFSHEDLYKTAPPRVPAGETTTAAMAAASRHIDWYYRYSYSSSGSGSATMAAGNLSNETEYEDLNWYDYFLVRGFAVVESAGIGSAGSEGFATCGADVEINAFRCIIEWLAGNRIAYSDKTSNIEIKADWSNGNVGMTGRSYAGTTQFGLATTGVAGLKTIVPVAGIASWYEYTNCQGVVGSSAYTTGLAWYVNSRLASPTWSTVSGRYHGYSQLMRREETALGGDYGQHWARRDYTNDGWFRDWGPSKIQIPMLIVHGANDDNVRAKQSVLMYQAAKKAGVDVRWMWHQGHHMTPTFPRGTPNATDTYRPYSMLCGDFTYDQWLNLWFSHHLYDLDNGVMELLPGVLAQDNNGTWESYNSWDSPESIIFNENYRVGAAATSTISSLPSYEDPVEYSVEYPLLDHSQELILTNEKPATLAAISEYESVELPFSIFAADNLTTVNSANGSGTWTNFLNAPTAGSTLYAITLPEDVTVKGCVEINMRAAITTLGSSANAPLRIHAKLVEVARSGSTLRYYGGTSMGSTISVRTVSSGGSWQGGGIASHNLCEFVQASTGTYRELAKGWMDLCNPKSGFDSYTAALSDSIVPREHLGEYFDYTLYLQPTVHTAKKGNRLVLFITTGGASTAAYSGNSAFTFTIDNDATNAVIPVEYHHEGETYEAVKLEPTCEEPGIMGTYCAQCHEWLADAAKIPALGHDLVQVVENGGIIKYWVCQREGCDYKSRIPNYTVYLSPNAESYFVGDTVLIDIMLSGDVNYTQVAADLAYDKEILKYDGYDYLSGWAAAVTLQDEGRVAIRSMPSANIILGAPCSPEVKIATLKFTVIDVFRDTGISAPISFDSLLVGQAGNINGAVAAPGQGIEIYVKPGSGNEWLYENIKNFPQMWDKESGQIRAAFSNANDRVVNEVVWIEAPLDTDLDGKRDLQRVVIRRPIETLPENGGLKCPAIINISPYVTTTSSGVLFVGFSDRIYEGFPEQGLAATRFQHTAFRARPAGVSGVLADRSHWDQIVGPANDMSYRALRDVTERRVGRGAESTVATYKELLADDMLKATQYSPQQTADYPWLPPARVPLGSQRDGTPFATAPGSAGPWSPANMLPRGYAVLQYRITGSDNAEGFLQYGMYQESLAGAAVIDWLNGRVRGFADPHGLIEVTAYWATGEAAASGTSYEGTMPMAAAVTGVEGLRTIFTGAPVTNAYNYYRENAMPYAPGGYVGEDLNAITMYCAGRMVNTASPTHPTPITSSTWDTYWDWLLYLTTVQDATTGDYSPAWDERNPLSFGYDFRQDLGVIMGHGFNDGNVKFRHTALLNETLKFYGVDVVKGLFHQAGHSMGNSRTGAWTTTAVMTEWADHYLYGVENDVVERTPNYSVEGNRLGAATAGTWTNYEIWPRGAEYQNFYPQGGRVGTISTTAPATSTSLIFQDDYLTRVTYPQTYNDAYYTNGVNGLVANRQHLWANGLNSANGALANLLLVRGQGANSALGSNQRPIWRNMLVGGLEGVTTAWSGSEQRLLYTGSALTAQFSKTKEIKDRLLFLADIEEDFTISGFTKMTAEIAASKDVGAISAMLLEWGTSSVKIVAMGSIDVRNPNPEGTIAPDVPGLANISKGGNWHANYLFQPVDIIPYGTTAPTAANFNSYTWEMDVTEYTFTAGNQMGIILYGSDPDFTYITRDATEFTVNIGPNTYLSLPVVSASILKSTESAIEEVSEYEEAEGEVPEEMLALEELPEEYMAKENIVIIE